MIRAYRGRTPAADPTVRIAENATLAGDITLGPRSNIWYGAVLRGDVASIEIGQGTNLQDGVVLHSGVDHPIRVGSNVTVGHRAIVHGCTVEDGCLIGMGAILLNGCVIGAGSLVAAGSLVTQYTVIPPGSLVMGSPAKVTRLLQPEEIDNLLRSAQRYCALAEEELPAWGAPGGDA